MAEKNKDLEAKSLRIKVRGTATGVVLGVAAGLVGATVATVWGGYELGSAINDALNVTSMVGRGALDLVTMGVVAGPLYAVGFGGGALVGGAAGAAYSALRRKGRKSRH